MDQAVLTDLPPEIAPAADGAELSDTDRSFVVVLSRVLGPQGLQAYAEMLQNLPINPDASEFYDLPADADERTRQGVAERLVPYASVLRAEHPGLPAQLDVELDAESTVALARSGGFDFGLTPTRPRRDCYRGGGQR